jgi:hypothetical protein
MTGRTFGYQGSFDDFVRQLIPDLGVSERRRSVGIADNLLRELEEFVNRFAVTASNDDGDITFDAAGTYSFQGAVSIEGGLSAGSSSWQVDADGNMWWGAETSYAAAVTAGDPSISASGAVEVTSFKFLSGYFFNFEGNSNTSGLSWEPTSQVTQHYEIPAGIETVVSDYQQADERSGLAIYAPWDTDGGGLAGIQLLGGAADNSSDSQVSLFAGGNNGSTGVVLLNGDVDITAAGDIDLNAAGDLILHGSDVFIENRALFFGGTANTDSIQYDNINSWWKLITAGTEVMRVDSSGRVYSAGGRYCFNIDGDAFIDWDDGSGDFEFQDNNVGVLRFARTGSGFTSYSGGSTRSWSFETAIDGPAEWYFPTRNAAGDAIEVYVTGFGLDPNTVAVMRADGDWENDNGRYGTLSDARTKRYIRPLEGHRDVLLNHPPKAFQKYMQADSDGNLFWRKEPINTYGYVAQEAHPSIVFQSGGDLLGVAEGRNVPWLHAGWIEHDERLARVESLLGLVS